MDTNTNDFSSFEAHQPTLTETAAHAAVGAAVSLAATAVLIGGLAAVGAVNRNLRARKARKLESKNANLPKI